MSNGPIENRKRAWFFVKVDPPSNAKDIAKRIYDNLGDLRQFDKKEGEYVDYVIIRADVVSGCTLFDIVVPVDANPDYALEEIKEAILAKTGREGITISEAQVTNHNPNPPHATFGYLTKSEFDEGRSAGVSEKDPEVFDLQSPYSPGSNAWG